MPSNVVKTPAEEKKWDKAKALAKEQGHGGDYAYIMGIFKKMNPNRFKEAGERVASHSPTARLKELLLTVSSSGGGYDVTSGAVHRSWDTTEAKLAATIKLAVETTVRLQLAVMDIGSNLVSVEAEIPSRDALEQIKQGISASPKRAVTVGFDPNTDKYSVMSLRKLGRPTLAYNEIGRDPERGWENGMVEPFHQTPGVGSQVPPPRDNGGEPIKPPELVPMDIPGYKWENTSKEFHSIVAAEERRKRAANPKGLPNAPELREPYYHMAEGVVGLEAVARKSGDPKLQAFVREVSRAEVNLIGYLNRTYNWD
jgi:hypothetical protein